MNRRRILHVNRTEKTGKVGGFGEKLIAAGVQIPAKSELTPKGSIRLTSKDLIAEQTAGASPSRKAVTDSPRSNAKQKKKRKKSSQSSQNVKNKKLLDGLDRQIKRRMRDRATFDDHDLQKNSTSFTEKTKKLSKFSIMSVQSRLETIALKHRFVSPESQFKPSGADEKLLSENFESAKKILSDQSDGDTEILSIGFDFGSTSSKVVLRFPYNPNLGAFALPAPDVLRADEHPYYWRSILWHDEKGEYSLLPLGSSTAIERLKVDFIREARAPSDDPNEPKLIDLHVAAYMALILRQSIGWISHKLKKTLAGRKLEISANFGFPAERVADTQLGLAFERCCAAAFQLARTDFSVTEQTLLAAFKVDSRKEIRIVPEFIGAVIGFFNTSRRRDGIYTLCDFGGLTCDCVCFRFYQRDDGSSIISILGSQVRNYGAEIVKVAIEQKVPKTCIVAALGNFVAVPIIDARECTGANPREWGGEMPLFRIGGGRKNPAYKDVFEWVRESLEDSIAKTCFREEKLELEMDSGIDVHLARGRNNGRLLVAYGLSWSVYDLPDWLTKDKIAPKNDKNYFDFDARFVGSEQT